MQRRLASVVCLAATLVLPRSAARAAGDSRSSTEVRALWVQRGTLISAPSVVSLVQTAKANGFNTLIVQVRGRGDAYYISHIEPRGVPLLRQHASFDPLRLVLATAHQAGLKVHAWVNVDLVADSELPSARNHVVYAHPEWLMVPRDLASDLAEIDVRRPEYVTVLARYAKEHSNRIEGLYLSPIQPAAADYTVSIVSDIVSRYDVDGIHLDYARFPNDEFDYSVNALAEFRADVAADLTPAEKRDYAERAAERPLFYTQMFPQRWQEFRRARVTALITKIRAAVKAVRPETVLSAAVWPDPNDAANRRFQDWRGWLETGLLDVICPMAYTTDAAVFRSQISTVVELAAGRPVWAGIGAFQIPAGGAVENIKAARRLGADGIVLFSYDNLTPDVNADRKYLGTVAKDAFQR